MWGLNGAARVLIEYTAKASLKGLLLGRLILCGDGIQLSASARSLPGAASCFARQRRPQECEAFLTSRIPLQLRRVAVFRGNVIGGVDD
jgi:hypothetical protein